MPEDAPVPLAENHLAQQHLSSIFRMLTRPYSAVRWVYRDVMSELRERERLRGESELFKQAWARSEHIGGWQHRGNTEVLYELATTVAENQDIVELGSYIGRSAAFLALGSPKSTVVHSIDLHGPSHIDTQETLAFNMRQIGVIDRVDIHKADSVAAAANYDGQPVGLLFVDAQHTADAVINDVNAWIDYLAEGAFIVFDDYNMPGVRTGVGELVKAGTIEKPIAQLAKLAIVGPTERLPERISSLI